MKPELVVMLTHHDRTVENAIEVFQACRDTKATCWGFKEVGIPKEEMKRLVQMMKDAGKRPFLEVVAYTEGECLQGVQAGIECGFETIMGTMYFPSVQKAVQDAGLRYMPFVGEIVGRPSVLQGSIQGMIDEANDLLAKGVDGIDLLAYRYTGDAEKLIEAFVAGVNAPVCIAGSIDSFQRLDVMKRVSPWGFTIGGAFFENKFQGSFAQQVDTVCEYIAK